MDAPDSRLAHAVLADNLGLRKGDSVVIEAWTEALPYARTFVQEARRLGISPLVLYEDDAAWWDAVEAKRFDSLGQMSRPESAAVAAADAYIFFWGPGDRARLNQIGEKSQEKVTAWNMGWYKLAEKAGLKGCRMWLGVATEPTAGMYEMDAAKWREGLLAAGTVPSAQMLAKGRKLQKAIEKGSELRLRNSNGTDLTFQLDGVTSRIDAGQVDAAAMKRPFGRMSNNPSGQILVGVNRGQATGTVVSNRTIYIGPDRYDDTHFRFENGVLVEHSVGLGSEKWEKAYKDAPKGKVTQSFFSIGLNPEARAIPPCEDCEEGSVLVGVGSNQFVGGKLKMPFQASALVGEGEVQIDGKTVARGGKVL